MAKSKAKLTRVKRQRTDENVIGATVTTADRSSGRFRRTDAQELAKRAASMVLWCAYFNATNCATHRMRLVRRADSSGKKVWRGKTIEKPSRLKYLEDSSLVGLKAASYMEDAGGKAEEVTDHPALTLLNNANPWQRGSTFGKACFTQFELYGRRYISLVQPSGEIPTELFCLFTDRVRPIPDEHNLLRGYIYGRETVIEREFKLDEILWQQYFPNPFDPYGGLSPLHCAFQEADIYSASTTSELSMWNKGARPDFAVKVPATTSDIQLKQMRAEIESRHQGPTKRGDFWFFRDGEVTPLQFNQKEMEYLAGRQDVRAMIGAAYGIPETFWRMNDANLAGSQTAQEFYARWTIAPRLAQDAEEWTETLLPLYGVNPGEYWFVYDDPVPENRAEVRADVEKFVSLGIWSKAYALELVGGRSPEEDGEETPEQRDDRRAQEARDHQTAQTISENPSDKPKPGDKSAHVHVHVKEYRLNDVSDGPDNPQLSMVERVYQVVSTWLKRVANDIDIPRIPESFTAEQLNAYVPDLIERLQEPVVDLFNYGASIPLGGSGTGQVSILAADYARSTNLRLAGSVTETQTTQIRGMIADGLAVNQPQAEMAQQIRTVLVNDAPSRATTIARTESSRAHQGGKQAGWKELGYWGAKWVLAPGACATCQAFVDQYGATRALEIPFAKKGEAIKVPGREQPVTLDYDDVYGPPLHVNCRCYLEPVEVMP